MKSDVRPIAALAASYGAKKDGLNRIRLELDVVSLRRPLRLLRGSCPRVCASTRRRDDSVRLLEWA